MSDRYKNLQVKQPNLAPIPDNNGWPEPLTDPSNPLRIQVTNGRNGETMQGKVTTSQQRENGHHKAEGNGGVSVSQLPVGGQRASNGGLSTSAFVSDPGGDTNPVVTMPPFNEDAIGRANDYPTITTQQHDGAHKKPEGE